MCGLVGIAGRLEHRDESMMKRLLVFDVFRGEHSTGLAGVRHGGEAVTAKINSHPLDLFQMMKFQQALTASACQAFIGHNRAATKGAVSSFNAHPFTYGSITGAHNGTLEFSTQIRLEELAGEKFNVDSQAVFAAINKVGIEKTIEVMHGSTDAWSLVWYDEADNTLNFLRNKERPLWFGFTDDFTKMIWASEHPIITAAKDLATTEYKMYRNERGSTYFQTDENIWYKYDLTKLKAGGKDRPKPTAKKVVPKDVPVKEAKDYTDPLVWPRDTAAGYNQTNSGKTSTSGADTKTPSRNVIELMGMAAEPYAGVISEERFTKLAEYGCSWCGADVDWGDLGVTINDADDIILCAEHSGCRNPDSNKVYLGEAEMRSLG